MKKFLFLILITALFSCNNESKKAEKTSETQKLSDNAMIHFDTSQYKTLSNQKSETGSFIAALETNKVLFKKLDPIGFLLKINDKQGHKITKADVTMDLEMPGMAMPKNEIKLKEENNGSYIGTALFTMKGDWKLKTNIFLKQQKEIIYFDLLVE